MKELHITQAYLDFLRLSRGMNDLQGDKPLDANHTALLETVALHWAQGQPLSVRQTIHLAYLGSPATLHKRLSRLITQGLLTAQFIGNDHRTKFIAPTDKGLDYFHRLGKEMIKALNKCES